MPLTDRVTSILDAEPTDITELSGGEVGTVYRVEFGDRPAVAAKVGETPLTLEARMLRYLDAETELPVPEVYYASDDLLVLEYVEGDGQWTPATERDVAEHVAALHEVAAPAFGFDHETLSGPFAQPNPWTDSWIEFFREQRLLHFAHAAHEEGVLPARTLSRIETLADRLEDLLVEPEHPSLLHGDLWAGNLIVREESLAAVLDPAIYFGHAELELAYVQLGGPLGDAFVERYRDLRGLAPGYDHRRAVYQAYHELEQARFFGRERLGALRDRLDALGL